MFRCPVCTADLTVDERTYRCEAGHSFDRARDGSVNLLAGPSARHRDAGDSAAMIAARRAVLDAGHYDRLRDAVLESVGDGTVLDVGCGEGHDTRPLADRDDDAWRGGIDISKPAIRAAAKRTRRLAYAVGNAYALPVVDGSIDVAVIVFGPAVSGELRRVVRPGGRVVVVVPGPDHLAELKALHFDAVEPHSIAGPSALASWSPPAIERLSYAMSLDRSAMRDLWSMTPYRWQVDRARDVVLLATATVTADFLVCRYDLA